MGLLLQMELSQWISLELKDADLCVTMTKNVASAELRLFKGHVRSTEKVVTDFADFTSYFDDFATQDWNPFMLKEDTSLG